MRFEKGVRSVSLKAHPLGYGAPPTDDFNYESPICRLGGLKDGGIWLTGEDLPRTIEVGVRMTPVWVMDETAIATHLKSKSCQIYPLKSIFSKVCVEITQRGYFQKTSGDEKIPFVEDSLLQFKLEFPKPYLYEKKFLTQKEGQKINLGTIEDKDGAIPCLWAYGGQQVGDDIHPFVFSLESIRQTTCIRPSSLLTWRERNIIPSSGVSSSQGEYGFQETFQEDQTRTLMESIEAGQSVIHLIIGRDETGKSLRMRYESYGFAKNFILYKRRG